MTTTIPQVRIVASGPISLRNQARQALVSGGFTVADTEESWGLPSWTDPITAHEQGAHNAGHTPGTPHPDTLHRRTTEEDQAAVDAAHQAAHQAVVEEARAAHEEAVAEFERHLAEVGSSATADFEPPAPPTFVEPPEPAGAPLLPEFIPETHACEHVGQDYEADPTVAFLTADGPHPDAAVAALAPFGWLLRMTVVAVGEVTSTEELTFGTDRIGDLEQQVAELKALIQGGNS